MLSIKYKRIFNKNSVKPAKLNNSQSSIGFRPLQIKLSSQAEFLRI